MIPVRVHQIKWGAPTELKVSYADQKGVLSQEVISAVGWLLGWDIDTRPVLQAIKADPVIAHLAEPLVGLRPYSQPTLLEALVKAILQQQVSFRSANQVTRKLVLAYGNKQQLEETDVFGFPSLEVLAGLSETDLRTCKLGYKAPYLVNLFRQITEGSLRLEDLGDLDSFSAIARLDELRGIGPWTAELAVLTGLRRFEVFPFGDLGIRTIISQLYLKGKPAKRRDVERVAGRWGEVRALVLYFLMCAQVLSLV